MRAEPTVMRQVGRFWMDSGALNGLWSRQLGWTAGLTVATLLTASVEGPFVPPELAVLPLGVGFSCAFPRRTHVAVAATVCGMLAALLLGLLTPESSTLSGLLSTGELSAPPQLHVMQSSAAVFTMGAFLSCADGGPCDGNRKLQGALALSTSANLAFWVSHSIVVADWRPMAGAVVGGLVTGAISSIALLVLPVRHQTVARIPGRDQIIATLGMRRRGPALEAWQADATLDRLCPDAATRDGLGEVAAWVYRLQWTRQQLDIEGERLRARGLEARIVELSARASSATDPFSRDRLVASVHHLQRLQAHRAILCSERAQVAALAEFAMAFLEEARTELVLAQASPKGPGPDRLPEVLHRLRSYTANRANERRTAREVSVLGG